MVGGGVRARRANSPFPRLFALAAPRVRSVARALPFSCKPAFISARCGMGAKPNRISSSSSSSSSRPAGGCPDPPPPPACTGWCAGGFPFLCRAVRREEGQAGGAVLAFHVGSRRTRVAPLHRQPARASPPPRRRSRCRLAVGQRGAASLLSPSL